MNEANEMNLKDSLIHLYSIHSFNQQLIGKYFLQQFIYPLFIQIHPFIHSFIYSSREYRGCHSMYSLKFFACETFNFANVVGQLFFIDRL